MILNFGEYLDLLREQELKEHVDFNDEIISIEEIEPQEMVDISLDGNNVFFANDVLIHNCATNKVDDVDNSAISDSLGTAMTADFLLFLLQNEEMKAKSEIVCKITKNRFNGKTDIWVMGIDYPKMRFFDIEKTNGQTFTSTEQKENYSTYANNEIKEQSKQDMKNLKKQDEIDSFLNDLGIS